MTRRLAASAVEKPWGRANLPPPFDGWGDRRIGEIRFEPPSILPDLLVKHIFADEALSVQVHPSDAQTMAAGLGRQGKEECWLVTGALPGARLAIGFQESQDRNALRAAARDGSIETLLRWFPVAPGDFFYIPANTVHAIGAGVDIVEIQQNSDVTWRLYDYGRPRPLHLDEGLAVACLDPYPEVLHRRLPGSGAVALVDGPFFRLDRFDGPPDPAMTMRYRGPLLIVPMTGTVRVDDETIGSGACGYARDISELHVAPGSRGLIAQPRRP